MLFNSRVIWSKKGGYGGKVLQIPKRDHEKLIDFFLSVVQGTVP